MRKNLLIAFVSILFSANAIYASFPVHKSKTTKTEKSVNEILKASGTNNLTEMRSVSSSSVHFNVAVANKIVTPKHERFALSKQLLKNMVGAGSGSGSNGWGIASFCCAILGLLVAAVPMGILAIIFGAIGLGQAKKGLAIAGLTIGIVDVVLGLIIIAALA